jgi:hypothetical protein
MTLDEQLELGKERVALCITNVKECYGCIKIAVGVVYVASEGDVFYDGMAFYVNNRNHKHQYKDVQVKGVMMATHKLPYDCALSVGDNGDVTLEQAELIVKTLGPISRGLADRVGNINECSFVEYAIQLANVLGASAFYDKPAKTFKYQRYDDITKLAPVLNRIIAENQVELGCNGGVEK